MVSRLLLGPSHPKKNSTYCIMQIQLKFDSKLHSLCGDDSLMNFGIKQLFLDGWKLSM